MPTFRGCALSGAGAALCGLWYMLGDPELLMLGAAMILAAVFGLIYVRFSPSQLAITRRLSSDSLHSGDTATVNLILENHNSRPVKHLRVHDEVEAHGRASFEMASLRRGLPGHASYQVLCKGRGVYKVGPATALIRDPLGLAERPASAPHLDRLVVYPRVDPLAGLPGVRGRDPSLADARPEHSQRGGEDFYTLREYQRGDDLRRVHWPYSAKTDNLMIRQLETPWHARALVLLDVRPTSYDSVTAFETAVSGAASVVTHLIASGFDSDLWAGDAHTIDTADYRTAMERLALVQTNAQVDMKSVAARVRQRGGGGALVLVTGTADRDLLMVQGLLAPDFTNTVLLGVSLSTPQGLVGFHRAGATTVQVKPGEQWDDAWLKAMRSTWSTASAS